LKINAIIPVKSLTKGKARLAGVLDDADRTKLNSSLLDRALDLAAAFPGLNNTIVVSADKKVLKIAKSRGAQDLQETGEGLNPALTQAMTAAQENKAQAVLVLPTDIPIANAEDLLALAALRDGMTIAADRRGIGTNALYVPTSKGFTFRFGDNSFAAHLKEAQISGLNTYILQRPNLGFDIDTPEDYYRWRDMFPDHARLAPPRRRSSRAE